MASLEKKLFPPFIHSWKTSSKASFICAGTLCPIAIWSVILFGKHALFIWLASVFSAVLCELLVSAFTKKITLNDGSAIVTGMLVACAMPPLVPIYIPVIASAFAILIVKAAFGGFGSNWMNPALGGIAFVNINWPIKMHEYILPKLLTGVDGLSSATPMTFAKSISDSSGGIVMETMQRAGYPVSIADSNITRFFNDVIFSHLGVRLPGGYIDLSIGLKSGSLGESAIIIVLIGSIILITMGFIKGIIPLSIIFSFSVLVKIFGSGLPGEELFQGDVLYALLTGGVLLSAFYMAPDPVSSPVGKSSGIIYGICIGVLCFVFRKWGAYTEGCIYAILIMNMTVPFLEKCFDKARISVRKE